MCDSRGKNDYDECCCQIIIMLTTINRHTALAPACSFPVNSWDQLKYSRTTRPRLIITRVINAELWLAYLLQ